VPHRYYGNPPFRIILLHGGPGATGSLAPLARLLEADVSVIEHIQEHDTITKQLAELDEFIEQHSELPVILVGHSWGAWLGYLFASEYPAKVKKLILISSGPFEEKYISQLSAVREKRLSQSDKFRLSVLMKELHNPQNKGKDQTFSALGKMMDQIDTYHPIIINNELLKCDYHQFEKVWKEASELRKSVKLLQQGHRISCPVVAIHGDFDPHPHEGVQVPLNQVLSHFRFILIENCGHKPWIEKYAKDRFLDILRRELKN
jgi:pimeloyl-ACP methyl ester carboxylesterase